MRLPVMITPLLANTPTSQPGKKEPDIAEVFKANSHGPTSASHAPTTPLLLKESNKGGYARAKG
jgi:hypothetical protein